MYRDYCPEYDRLKKLKAEAREKAGAKQMEQFENDLEEEEKSSTSITVRRNLSQESEILLRNRAVGGDSSDEGEEREGRGGIEEEG